MCIYIYMPCIYIYIEREREREERGREVRGAEDSHIDGQMEGAGRGLRPPLGYSRDKGLRCELGPRWRERLRGPPQFF